MSPSQEQSDLVGEPGVGKTAIAEGLALRILERRSPFGSSRCNDLFARSRWPFGGHEIPRAIRRTAQSGHQRATGTDNTILFIDEIHTIVGAGATSGGTMDASNILKPALADGTLRCIGSTTFEEYRKSFERDRALARRFQKVEILEPTLDETHEILKGLKRHYEEFHEVEYTDGAVAKRGRTRV